MDHYAVIGPPGTGKTTYLKGQVERAASVFGGNEVMVCSLTKAAAAEIKGRADSIPEHRIGTLHSFAFRSIGCPELAEGKIGEWNTANPNFALGPTKRKGNPEDDDDASAAAIEFDGDEYPGDDLHTQMELWRHDRRPRDAWRGDVKNFAQRWDEWMNDSGYVDFTGFIEGALETPHAPGMPLAMFVDEAQDMSRLEISLIKRWAAECNTLVAVGDGAQALYTFRGAEPDEFLTAGDAAHLRVLQQSYRVPRAVHAAATTWAAPLLTGVEYRPRDYAGSVVEEDEVSLKDPDSVAEALIDDLACHTGTVMFQAQTNRMVASVVQNLKESGVPFHNPNRLRSGAWNPLGKRKKGTSTIDRFLAWIDDKQSEKTISLWLPMLKSQGILARGAKKRSLDTVEHVRDLFASDEAMNAAFSGDLNWLMASVTNEFADYLSYIVRVYRNYGRSGIVDTPRLMVGTVHSYKGAEADSVWLAPDLSKPAWDEYDNEDPKPVQRLMYVGMTRARDALHVLRPKGGWHACVV